MVETMVCDKVPVNLICKTLQLSRSGYYAWLKRPESERKKDNDALVIEMKQIHEESRGTYGLPRIRAKLQSMGRRCGKSRTSSLMKKLIFQV